MQQKQKLLAERNRAQSAELSKQIKEEQERLAKIPTPPFGTNE